MFKVAEEQKEFVASNLFSMAQAKAFPECICLAIYNDEQHQVIYISFEPENNGAKRLYEKLGFVPDGRVIDGEIVYKPATY